MVDQGAVDSLRAGEVIDLQARFTVDYRTYSIDGADELDSLFSPTGVEALMDDGWTVSAPDTTISKVFTYRFVGANDLPTVAYATDEATDGRAAILVNATGAASGVLAFDDAETANSALLFKTGVASGRSEPAAAGTLAADPLAGLVPADVAGAYGTFAFSRNDGTGELAWTYALDRDNASVRGLSTGQTLYEKLSVAASDGAGDSAPLTVLVAIVPTAGPAVAGNALPTLGYAANPATDGGRRIDEDLVGPIRGTLSYADSDGELEDLLFKVASTAGFTVPPDAAPSALRADPAPGANPAAFRAAYGWFGFERDDDTGELVWIYDLLEHDAVFRNLTTGGILYEKLTVVVSDGVVDSAPVTVLVTIDGANDAPRTLPEEGYGVDVMETQAGTVSGGLFFTDPERLPSDGDLVIKVGATAGRVEPKAAEVNTLTAAAPRAAPASLAGDYGTFSFSRDWDYMRWFYDLDNDNTAVRALNAGDRLYEKLTIAISDGVADSVPIVVLLTIHGEGEAAGNSAPVVTYATSLAADGTAVIPADSAGVVRGTFRFSDADTDDSNATLVLKTGATSSAAAEPAAAASLAATTLNGEEPADIFGAYGRFSFSRNDAAGGLTWTYDVDEANVAVRGLGGGQRLFEKLTAVVGDRTGDDSATITALVTILGTGGTSSGSVAPPTVTGNTGQTHVDENDRATKSGTFTVADSDTPASGLVFKVGTTWAGGSAPAPAAANTLAASRAGAPPGEVVATFGTFTFDWAQANGTLTWTYDLDNDNPVVDALKSQALTPYLYERLTVVVSDGTSDSAAATAVIEIRGQLDPAFVAYATDRATDGMATIAKGETGNVGGTLAFGDPDDPNTAVRLATGADSGTAVPPDPAPATLTQTFSGRPPADIATDYGMFRFQRINATGELAWTYDLDEANATVRALAPGANLYEKLTVSAADGSGDLATPVTVLVTIEGFNNVPTIGYATGRGLDGAGAVVKDETGTIGGEFEFGDLDGGGAALVFKIGVTSGNAEPAAAAAASLRADPMAGAVPADIDGLFGTFSFTRDDTGGHLGWTYDLDEANAAVRGLGAGGALYEKLAVAVGDGIADSAAVTALVSILGENEAPVLGYARDEATDGMGSIASDSTGTIGGTFTFSDMDHGRPALSFTATSLAGTLWVPQSVVSGPGAAPADLTGRFGTYSFTRDDASGELAWTYDVDGDNLFVRFLSQNLQLTETLSVVVSDGVTESAAVTAAITITGNGRQDVATGRTLRDQPTGNAVVTVQNVGVDVTDTADTPENLLVSLENQFAARARAMPGVTSVDVDLDIAAAARPVGTGNTAATVTEVANADVPMVAKNLTSAQADKDAWLGLAIGDGTNVFHWHYYNTRTGHRFDLSDHRAIDNIARGTVVDALIRWTVDYTTYTLDGVDARSATLTSGAERDWLVADGWTVLSQQNSINKTFSYRFIGGNEQPVLGPGLNLALGLNADNARGFERGGAAPYSDPDHANGDIFVRAGVTSGASVPPTPEAGGLHAFTNPRFNVNGVHGSFRIDKFGTHFVWEFDLWEGSAALNALNVGDRVHEKLTFVLDDGFHATDPQTLLVTIHGVNEAPEFAYETGGTAEPRIAAVEGEAGVVDGGVFRFSDIDNANGELVLKAGAAGGSDQFALGEPALAAGEAGAAPEAVAGRYGTFTFSRDDATGEMRWAYELDQGNPAVTALLTNQFLYERLKVVVDDGGPHRNESPPLTALVTIHGRNSAPTIAYKNDPLTDGLSVVNEEDQDATASGVFVYDTPDLGGGFHLRIPLIFRTGATSGSVEPGPAAAGDLVSTSGRFENPADLAGDYGTFSFDRRDMLGELRWTYDLDETDADVQAIAFGGRLYERLTVVVGDHFSLNSPPITALVTINGLNDAPTLAYATDEATDGEARVGEDETGTVGGELAFGDIDNGHGNETLAFRTGATAGDTAPAAEPNPAAAARGAVPDDLVGTYGTFRFARSDETGRLSWTYDLDEANADVQALLATEELFEKLTVVVGDGIDVSAAVTALVTISGANETPTVAYATDRLTDGVKAVDEDEEGEVGGTFDFGDGDGTAALLVVKTGATHGTAEPAPAAAGDLVAAAEAPADIAGEYGTFSFTRDDAAGTLAWTYDLDEDDTVVQGLDFGERLYEMLTVVVGDGTDDSAAITALVTIRGLGNPPAGTNAPPALAYATDEATDGDAEIGEDRSGVVAGVLHFDGVDDPNADVVFRTGATAGTSEPAEATANTLATAAAGAAPADLAGTHGTFRFARSDARGELVWTYDLDEASSVVQRLVDGDRLYEKLTVVAGDGTDDSPAVTVLVTIFGENDAPIMAHESGQGAGGAAGIGEDDTRTIGGSLSFSDTEQGNAGIVFRTGSTSGEEEPPAAPANTLVSAAAGAAPAGFAGSHGMFRFIRDNDAGTLSWTYDLDEADPAVQALRAGQRRYDKLTVVASDGATDSTPFTVAVAIAGVNDAPVVRYANDRATDGEARVEGDAMDAVSGSFAIEDIDHPRSALTVWAGTTSGTSVPANAARNNLTPGGAGEAPGDIDGDYGAFSFVLGDDGQLRWSYAVDSDSAAVQGLDVGETAYEKLTVVVGDGTDETAPVTVVVTIDGVNDAPFIGYATDEATDGARRIYENGWYLETSGSLVFGDHDDGDPNSTLVIAYGLSHTLDTDPPEANPAVPETPVIDSALAGARATVEGHYGSFTLIRDDATGALDWVYLIGATEEQAARVEPLDSNTQDPDEVHDVLWLRVSDDESPAPAQSEALRVVVTVTGYTGTRPGASPAGSPAFQAGDADFDGSAGGAEAYTHTLDFA